ncbi:MAG: hypothetical protein HFG91_08280 [Acholeplasmatales bacterium]|nr:hypothetical protein [Acholeplasmatales bacterium]
MLTKYIVNESYSEKLEQEFKSTCTLYPKKGFGFGSVYGKIVKSGNKYIFIVLTSANVKTGMIFSDEANKSKFQVTHVNKKYKTYPENKTDNFIYLDICDIKYEVKKK